MILSKIIPFFICLVLTKGQWIDPHSMDTNYKNKLPNKSHKVQEKETIFIRNCDSDLHLRRVIRLILSNAHLENAMGYFEGHVNLKLSTFEHQFLMDFSQSTGDIEEKKIMEISSILETAFQKSSFDKYHEIVLTMQEKFFELIFNRTSGALASASVVLYVLYRLMKAEFTWKSIVKYFLFFTYVIDFVITYLHILREEEIDNMVSIKMLGVTPPECNPEKMSWWTYGKTRFESVFFENPCKIYYQTTYNDHKYLIAPARVFVKQFKTFMEPIGDLGEAFGKFGRGMFTSLPWGLNVVLFPIMLIGAIIIMFTLFLFITKPNFKLSLFKLFTIELGKPNQGQSHVVNNTAIYSTPNRTRQIESGESRQVRRRKNRGREVGEITSDHRELVEDVLSGGQNEVKEPKPGGNKGQTDDGANCSGKLTDDGKSSGQVAKKND